MDVVTRLFKVFLEVVLEKTTIGIFEIFHTPTHKLKSFNLGGKEKFSSGENKPLGVKRYTVTVVWYEDIMGDMVDSVIKTSSCC